MWPDRNGISSILGIDALDYGNEFRWVVISGVMVFYLQRALRNLLRTGSPWPLTRSRPKIVKQTADSRSVPKPFKPIQPRRRTEPSSLQESSWLPAFPCCVARADEVDEDAPSPIVSLSSSPTNALKVFPPTVPGVDVVDPQLIKDLRARLVDLLGKPGSQRDLQSSERSEAAMTVEKFGGERSCLSRFLRARQLNVRKAEEMLRESIEFRIQHRVNHIFQDPHSMLIWETGRQTWPMSAPMFTSDGSVVIYLRVAHFIGLHQQNLSEDRLRTLYLCMMESGLRLQQEGRSRRRQGPGDEMPTVYEVYDMDGVGLAHFRIIFALMKFTRVLSIGQAHYPENLRTAFLLNAVRGFELGWNMCRKVLNERTQAKVHIVAGNGRHLLSKVLGVSQESVNDIINSLEPYSSSTCRGLPSDRVYVGRDLIDELER